MNTETPITCEQAEELLTLQHDEALSPAERQDLDAHVAGCETCCESARAWQALHKVLAEELTAPAPVAPATTARWQEAARAARCGRLRRLPWWAAAALVPIVGLLLLTRPEKAPKAERPPPSHPEPAAVVMAEVAAPRSVVWLSPVSVRVSPPGAWVKRTLLVREPSGVRVRITVERTG